MQAFTDLMPITQHTFLRSVNACVVNDDLTDGPTLAHSVEGRPAVILLRTVALPLHPLSPLPSPGRRTICYPFWGSLLSLLYQRVSAMYQES